LTTETSEEEKIEGKLGCGKLLAAASRQLADHVNNDSSFKLALFEFEFTGRHRLILRLRGRFEDIKHLIY
jgi:hypothetical protein